MEKTQYCYPASKPKHICLLFMVLGGLVLMFVTVLWSLVVCTSYCTHKATPSFPLAGIFRPPGSSDLQALKKSGFTARQLRVAGCDIAILRECGYHVLNLLDAGFRPDEITAAGLDVRGVQANHTRCSLFHAGFEMTEMLTSHLRTSFLVGRLHTRTHAENFTDASC